MVAEEGEGREVGVGSGREGFGGKGNELSAWGARKWGGKGGRRVEVCGKDCRISSHLCFFADSCCGGIDLFEIVTALCCDILFIHMHLLTLT